MSKIFRKSEKGFTLVEILLISVVVVLVAVSITMLFSGGRRTWTSADKDSETIQNAVVGMEKLVREIKNSPGLTYFSNSEVRFAVLRKDSTDLDGDGDTNEYVSKYARVKRDGSYLKYGERDEDSENDGDWTLSNLAYPVTNLSFSFKKLDGSDAIPGTDEPSSVRSVLINMTTSENGVTIPLTSRAFLSVDTAVAANFDGTPNDPDDPDPDDHHFNEGNDETDNPPPPGSKGDGVKGWGLSDYCVYGDRAVSIANSVEIKGNVGTRSLSGASFNSANSSKIRGYLVVKGSFNMSNSGAISDESIAAGCVPGCSINFANNCKANANFWTLNNITMSNSSRINGTVYQLAGATITCHNTSGYTERVEISSKPEFMKDPMYEEGDWNKTVFPQLPPAENFNLPGGSNLNYANQTATIPFGNYGNVTISNSSRITLTPGSTYKDFSVSNSSYVYIPAGDYYFNRLTMSNSSRLTFNFVDGTRPVRLFVKTTASFSNSSSFRYENGGPNNGADLLYLEANSGVTFSNSVQWRGFIYAPNGNVTFSNSTTLAGAVYSGREVQFSNSTTATYIPPAYNFLGKQPILLGAKFYPQNQ